MGSGGHNVKPVKELKKAGTFRPSRHANRAEAVAKPLAEAPKPPQHFDQRHREKWAEVCEKVFMLGILHDQDLDLIELYVCNWLMWKDAAAEVAKRGITFSDGDRVIKNPAFTIMQEAGKVVSQTGSVFGFSPRARMGIKTDPQEPDDALAGFLNN